MHYLFLNICVPARRVPNRCAQFQYKKIELNPMANERKKLSLKSM